MAATIFSGLVSNDYHQIYLCDSSLPVLPDDYSDEMIARRVMSGPEAIVLQIEREMPVPIDVVLHDARPMLDSAAFQHVVETSLTASSGVLVLAPLLAYAPDAPHLTVPAGKLGAIVTFDGLDTLSDDGLEGNDRYAIHVWPDANSSGEVVVLKRYPALEE